MSKIDELLKNEKVEWKKLGDVCEITKGKQYNRNKMLLIGKYPVINGGINPSGYIDIFNERENTITISQGGASAGYVNFISSKFWLGAHAYCIRPKKEILNNKYIYHILKYKEIELKDKKEGAGIPSISKVVLYNLQIPVPSLETQEKIVEILDKFTNYVTELQAELQDRTKQYEYYRDMLLSEEYLDKLSRNLFVEQNNKINFVQVKKLCNRQRGIKITAKEMRELDNNGDNCIKVFAGGNTTAMISPEILEKDDIITKPSVIVKSRGNIDFEYYELPFSHKSEMWSYSSKDSDTLNIKYLYYIFKNNLKYFEDNSIAGKLPQISTPVTDNYKIPLPSLEIQNKVVEMLDKFQALLADTEGLLPQEIEQRQKQYEYFREKLLTFDENVVSINQSINIISNRYFDLLEEACDIVGIKCFEVKNKLLKEISIFADGTHQTPKYRNNGIPFISVENIKNIYDTYKYISETDYNSYKYKPEKGDLFMTRIGDIGTCAVVKDNRDLAYYVTLALIKLDKKIIVSKFLKFFIESRYGRKELYKRTLHTANPIKINLSDIGKIKIPVPPIPVQEHVVSILDKFDELVNDISAGIPKEIELRQKEYEFYREKLLNFPR